MKYKVKLNGKIYEVEVEKGNAELLSEYDAISAPAAAPAAQEPQMTEAQAQAIAQQQMAAQQAAAANMPTQEQMNMAMGMAYNTKRCPECQAVCFNSPVECPYCHADLKGVKPLTPEELEALE